MNTLYLSDSYKVGHAPQYPPKTEYVSAYFESRGGKFKQTLVTGLQGIISKHLKGRVVFRAQITEAKGLFAQHFGQPLFNEAGWEHIIRDHGGHLPLSIRAVAEGSVVETSNALMTVENTCPKCWWVPNYFETLLVQSWFPATVGSISYEAKKLIARYLERTGDLSLLDFKLHDFGCRGVSSMESAAIGGCAHLVNFKGTDTLPALAWARQHYGEKCAGFSVPASEHSTITSWGEAHEVDAFRNILEQYPTGIVACVSDSYDIERACTQYWGKDLHDVVMARDGMLVVRPDSGNPPHVVLQVLDALAAAFGTVTNTKGYKVLDPHVRVIQGDGCSLDTIEEILHQMSFHQYSADNITFGMGGGLLQKCDRDTQKFAFKCSSVVVDGERRDVWKSPVGDTSKHSKRGQLVLLQHGDGSYETITQTTYDAQRVPPGTDHLVEVFRDGKMLRTQSLREIRARANTIFEPMPDAVLA